MKFLSIKALARALGVSESSMKRWANQGRLRVSRTAGGHRRVALDEAVRFIRASQMRLVDPTALGVADLTAPSVEASLGNGEADTAIQQAMVDGREAEVRGAVLAMYLRGRSVASLCDGPLKAGLYEVGSLWQHDRAGIYVEHRATAMCVGALHQLHALLPPPREDAPVAIGAAPSGDVYQVPTLMAATVLAELGFRAINLGPEMPLEVLGMAADRARAVLVWVSVSVATALAAQRDAIDALGQSLSAQGRRLIVGGQAWQPRPPRDGPHWHFGASMGELQQFGEKLLRIRV